jgi:orotate phosphoribosyltransferase-like protein
VKEAQKSRQVSAETGQVSAETGQVSAETARWLLSNSTKCLPAVASIGHLNGDQMWWWFVLDMH